MSQLILQEWQTAGLLFIPFFPLTHPPKQVPSFLSRLKFPIKLIVSQSLLIHYFSDVQSVVKLKYVPALRSNGQAVVANYQFEAVERHAQRQKYDP